jgi:hypothetical protein
VGAFDVAPTTGPLIAVGAAVAWAGGAGDFFVALAVGLDDDAAPDGVVLALGVAVGVALGVAVGVPLGVAVGVGEAAAAHVDLVTVFESNVIAPLRARRRPAAEVPVSAVTEVRARMVPTKTEFVPSVAELPTCQNTLHAWAPLISATRLPEAVMSVLAAWKMKTAP